MDRARTTHAPSPLTELQRLGQSIWLDYIRRQLMTSGELRDLVDNRGVTGVTANHFDF
jgi:transaldolase/glucose-6-phosphate isomerase